MSKRIEYQKFIRNKFENPRYRGLLGLSDNSQEPLLNHRFRRGLEMQDSKGNS